jgi:hypothetical protein
MKRFVFIVLSAALIGTGVTAFAEKMDVGVNIMTAVEKNLFTYSQSPASADVAVGSNNGNPQDVVVGPNNANPQMVINASPWGATLKTEGANGNPQMVIRD